jgi:hypothetical protein
MYCDEPPSDSDRGGADDDDDDEHGNADEKNKSCSSYDLFGVERDQTAPRDDIGTQQQLSGAETVKRSRPADEINDEINSVESKRPRSSWLSSFLASKRDSTIMPPPINLPNNDTFLREFSGQFTNGKNNSVVGEEEKNEDEDGSEGNGIGGRAAANDDGSVDGDSETNGDVEVVVDEDEEDAPIPTKLMLFNLPYNMTLPEV